MKAVLLEEKNEEKRAYKSTIIEPKNLSILNNKLSLRIVQELSKKPCCALDIARNIEVHEQKIYYHLRKLELAGIIKLLRTEKRFGMTAKIYDVVSPVVATKLYEDGNSIDFSSHIKPDTARVLKPFVNKGKFNALVILGDTYSHGRYDMHSTEGVHAFDLAYLLGYYTNEMTFPNYKFDTEINEQDLKNNLILIGHPQTNVWIEKINSKIPLYFNESDDWSIESRKRPVKLRDPRCGVIIKMDNPFDKTKKILIFAGRTRGTRSAILAFTKFMDRIESKISDPDNFHLAVQGFDMSGNKIIDEIKIVE